MRSLGSGVAVGTDGLVVDRATLRGVLTGVSLTVQPGKFLAILGDGRAGKSALMRAIGGTGRLGSGMITFAGADLRRVRPHRRGFGVVAQADALFGRLSLADNIAYPLRVRGIGRVQRARLVEAALESVLLDDAGRLPAQASPAERQRAWLARATVFGPGLLLLDEPLSHQAQGERGDVLAALRRLHLLLGTTTILATRVAGDALALADQVAVLDRGEVMQISAPEALYDRPISAAAAQAAGETNLLPGVVRQVDEDGIAQVALACGPVVEGLAASAVRARDRCVLCLRPERVAVAPTEAAEMGEGALDAVVLEALHLGDMVRLRLLLGAGQEVLVKRPAAAGLRGLRPGEGVAIAWQPQTAFVFPVTA